MKKEHEDQLFDVVRGQCAKLINRVDPDHRHTKFQAYAEAYTIMTALRFLNNHEVVLDRDVQPTTFVSKLIRLSAYRHGHELGMLRETLWRGHQAWRRPTPDEAEDQRDEAGYWLGKQELRHD